MSLRRLMLATVVSLCSLAGVVVLAPVALAVTPPVVEEEAVSNVAGTSATLQAKINPEGSETTYRFEYGTSEAYGSSIPVPDGFVGSGSVGVAVSAHSQDLAPSTIYHYRVVALVASRSETVAGSGGSFTTQPAGSEFALPDGRQWELVSPPNKHGAQLQSLAEEGPIQAAEDGSALTYGANVPTELEPAGYGSPAFEFEQVRSARGAQGWASRDIAMPRNSAPGSFGLDEYQFFSGDLSLGLAYPAGNDTQGEDRTLLSSEASELTPYIRRESLCDALATASECYLPVLTGKEGFADVPPGTEFGHGSWLEGGLTVKVQGASPDLRHVVLKSFVALTTTPIANEEVYEWSADVPASEALQLVSVLPASEGGGPAKGAITVGADPEAEWPGARHSISSDGSRIFWTTDITNFKLYMRDIVRKETVRLDVQQPGVPSGGNSYADFQIASSHGSKVFFTDFDEEQRLTAQSGTHGQDLYECEIVEEAGKLTCKLTDLTPETSGESAEVRNLVLGASEDGSYAYFVANGVLGDGAEHGATQGNCTATFGQTPVPTCNLYEYHDGTVTYIATLSENDQADWAIENYTNRELGKMTARVSPDGRYLAFMSDRSLTGYDNRDAVSGLPDAEVYMYDAVTKRLACASCNPTGSRPIGVNIIEFDAAFAKTQTHRANIVDTISRGGEYSVAANLPGGNSLKAGGFSGTLYQPRALSDGGRLFFNSSDALVSQDVNSQEDVYQFEPQGVSGCTASSSTFNPKSDGCVGLVSSGTSSEESGFLDASVGGGDVYFLTTNRLTSQDKDTSYDVYDAHECSAAVPCVPLPVPPPPCTSGDSCKAAPSPQPSIFGAPASATFSGAGDIVESSKPVVRPKAVTLAQKLARALKACRGKPKRKRAACVRQARKRYGVKTARKASRTMRRGQG